MKKLTVKIVAIIIAVLIVVPSFCLQSFAEKNMGKATGYTCPDDVKYVEVKGTVCNWGAREEKCLFLSKYALEFYKGENSFENLSKNKGGTSEKDAYESELYKALNELMKSNHKKETDYGETRYLYCYTDCTNSDYNYISSFYSGDKISGTWDSGKTWNREHTWPKSKSMKGSDENDIMMLRPTIKSENSARGNKAYGESSGFYNVNDNVKGDCARILLYVYVRYGNIDKMFGSEGVIENLDTLLKWMEIDPVDTFEMGRNDSVQSITGTRNVFVDFPMYAFTLFGREVPENMSVPSDNSPSDKLPEKNNNEEVAEKDNNRVIIVIVVAVSLTALGLGAYFIVIKKKKTK